MDPELFADTKILTAERISSLTGDVMEELSRLWFNIYEPDIVEKNILLLEQHVRTLFVDITNESVKRRDDLQAEVNRLMREASDLQRLLKVDCDLRHDENQVPLYNFKTQLDKSLEGLRIQLKERQDEIEDLLVQQNEICTELGESPKPLGYDPLPSAGQLQEFRAHLCELFAVKESRLVEFKELRQAVRQNLEMLELETLSADDQKLVEGKKVQYSKANLLRLHQMRDRLDGKCSELRRLIDQTRDKVRNLWKCLETPVEDREKIEYYKDYHRTAYDMWHQEYDRCETEKRQNLKKFVDKVRQELLIMWEKTLKSDDEKRRFKYFTSDVYSDDLIRIHEIELEELSQFYNENEAIFALIAERKLLWARMEALEEKANAPNRFNNRGGQLLREEKERKTIAHKLPKIEQELRELVQEFEATHKRKFTVYGQEVLEMVEQEWERKRAGKKLLTARKKEPMQTLTPGRRTNTPHPSRTINSSTASRMAPNTTSVSTALKRKMAPTPGRDAPAKRNILGDLNSPRPSKTPAKVKKTIDAIHVAQMKRRSSGRMRQKKHQQQQQLLGGTQNPHASVSYDMFEEFISSTPSHCRSSEVHHNKAAAVREEVTKLKTPSRIAKSSAKYAELTPLRQKPARTMLRRLSETADITTPGRGLARMPTTPGAASTTTHGNLSRISPRSKLSTKELPIIF